MVNKNYLTLVHDRVVLNDDSNDLDFNNIIYLNFGDSDLITKIMNHVLKSDSQKILIFPYICYGVLNNSLFKTLDNKWNNNNLYLLDYQNFDKYSHLVKFKNNSSNRQLPYCFNKNKININNIKYLNFKTLRDYIYNIFSPNVIKLKYEDNNSPSSSDFRYFNNIFLNNEAQKSQKIEELKITEKINDYWYPSINNNIIKRKPNEYCKITFEDVEYKQYKPSVCMCLYSRPENLELILSALEKQTYKNFEFFIWNNRPELKEWIDVTLNHYNIETEVHHAPYNMGSYSRLLMPPMTNNNPIIYIDDDKLPHEDFVEYCLQRYIRYPFALQSRWAFQQPRTYWGPPRIRAKEEDIEVDYVGTNMMVLDKSVFNDPMMLEIPEEWKNIEDLWMCHVARKNQQRPLYSMLSKVTEIKDNKDQYHSLATKKNEMYQWMKEDGFQTIDNQKGPIISIIIVTYNRWDLSKKCIDSVIENTPKGTYEIIVVDNCSSDGTKENLKNYKNQGLIHKIIFNNSNYQLGRAFNSGYNNVSDQVDYIMTLNNDHFMMNGWYYNMLAAFKNKSIDFVSGLARGNFFHLKDEIIDRDTNCKFFVLSNEKIETYKHNTSDLYLLYDNNVQEIGEALIFRSELIFNNIVKWFEGFPGGGWKGSYHAKMIKEILKPYNLKGVELGRPCALTQKNHMAKYKSYYRVLFNSREKDLPHYDYHFDIIRDKEEYYKWTNYLEESSNGK